MPLIHAIALTSHVILGLIGVIATYALTFSLGRERKSQRMAQVMALIAFLGYVTSWLTGGYYYALYYGAKVKPKILEGDYDWAHKIVMEAKEHVFLILPIMAATLFLLTLLTGDALRTNAKLRTAAFTFSLVMLVLATAVTLSGVLITGGSQ